MDIFITDNESNMKKTITLVNKFVEEALDDQDGDDHERILSKSNADRTNSEVLDDDYFWENLDAVDEALVNQVTERNYVSILACFAHTLQLIVKVGLNATG